MAPGTGGHRGGVLPPTTAIALSPRHSGKDVLVGAGLALCLALAALSGPVAWFFLTQFIWTSEEPADYQTAITVCLVNAGLLLLGELAVLAFRGGLAHHVVIAAGLLLQGLLIGTMYDDATAPTDPGLISPVEYSLVHSLEAALLTPTSWPLMLLLVGLLVRRALRGSSTPEQPRPLGR